MEVAGYVIPKRYIWVFLERNTSRALNALLLGP